MTTADAKTLPLLIGEFSTKLSLDIHALLPPVILALIFRRFIIRSLTTGAVK